MKVSLALVSAALLTASTVASAQVTTDCHTVEIPMEFTNFLRVVSLPKFDPALGELQGVELQVVARATGMSRLESLDAAPSVVNTRFSVDVTVTRSDSTVVMFMVPIADFQDSLTAYDGILDFGGTSGITRDNIQAMDQRTSIIDPTPENLALFTGTGSMEFTADAAGSSEASGAGNLQTQFDTRAGVEIEVCYRYLITNPPTVSCPGNLIASVGVPISFEVCATDPDVGDVVTLNGVLPNGAVATPPFPVVGNPACTTITWTPRSSQVGETPFTFTANDIGGDTAICTTIVGAAECHMVFGVAGGSSSTTLFGHLYDTQLARVRVSFPVTMTNHPSFQLSSLPPVVTMQVLMYNPLVFPSNSSQWSRALRLVRNPDQGITTTYSGTQNGIDVQAELFQSGGVTRVRFPFQILGT